MPAAAVPVSAEVRRVLGNDDHVTRAFRDSGLASGTDVVLAGLVRLHGRDEHRLEGGIGHGCYPRNAQRTTAIVSTPKPTTSTMSVIDRDWGRKGLKPIAAW